MPYDLFLGEGAGGAKEIREEPAARQAIGNGTTRSLQRECSRRGVSPGSRNGSGLPGRKVHMRSANDVNLLLSGVRA